MIIAPGVRIKDWKSLNLKNKKFSGEWEKAIGIFEKRIRERYLEPARILVETEADVPAINRRYGFSIMALLCLLGETLQCFIEGRDTSKGSTKQVFSRFLLNNEPLKTTFDGNLELAEAFYKHIRCGILHQAEITGGAKLWSIGPTIRVEHGKITVNRNKFYGAVLKVFEAYLVDLRKDNEKGMELRAHLEKKMTFIIKNSGVEVRARPTA